MNRSPADLYLAGEIPRRGEGTERERITSPERKNRFAGEIPPRGEGTEREKITSPDRENHFAGELPSLGDI